MWNFLVSIIMTWFYNRTNGSLLAPVLFHPAMNAFGNQFFGDPCWQDSDYWLGYIRDCIRPDVGETT
jgi:membrane protease YdiL (CAAX protease family)